MNDQSSQIPFQLGPLKVCQNPECGHQTNDVVTKCPECGRPIWTQNEFRVISAMLLPLGLILAVGGGALFVGIYLAGEKASKGGLPMQILVLAISAFLFSFGLSALAVGVWQVIFARVNRVLIKILLFMIVAFFSIAIVGRVIVATIMGE